jgi:4a-hydroxytetrahydrobiopterin dehydratase
MDKLADKTCIPCMGGVPPLESKRIEELRKQTAAWQVVGDKKLRRRFEFSDFASALAFTNRVGELAEAQGHHPDIYLAWGMVEITIWTHKIDGLTESDFILAAKIDKI